MWYLSEICVIYFKITIRSIFSSTLTEKWVIFSRHAWLNKGSRLLFLIRQDSIMLDYCSVIEPMMQQHAVAGGGASTWGMNYNTFSLGINILMFFVVLLVSPQSFVVFRRKKKFKPWRTQCKYICPACCGWHVAKQELPGEGLEISRRTIPSQETINCYGIFFASLAPLSAASLTWRTLCTRKAHVSPRGFPGERFTNHSPLVSANKADSFEIGSAGILRPTPFTLSPEAWLTHSPSLLLPLSIGEWQFARFVTCKVQSDRLRTWDPAAAAERGPGGERGARAGAMIKGGSRLLIRRLHNSPRRHLVISSV